MTRKGVLTKDINTAIICIGLHGGLHRNYFAVFGWVPTDGNTERSHVCHQSSLSDSDVLMLTQDMAAPRAQPFLQQGHYSSLMQSHNGRMSCPSLNRQPESCVEAHAICGQKHVL